MYKMLNRMDFVSMDNFKEDLAFLAKKYGFDGFELIKYMDTDNSDAKDYIKGYHMRFFPSWYEFYMGDMDSIYAELKDKKYFKSLCGGEEHKKELLDYYRKELEIAKELEVEYLVLHASNSKVTEAFTYEFRYSDKEILDGVISLVNELFDNEKHSFKLLLENLWWPGLKLTSKEEAKYLLDNIKYKNIGFMLDTGHMINTNKELRSSGEAVEYIKKCVENLGEYKKYIHGMHLNYSLSGEYVKKTSKIHREKRAKEKDHDIEEIMKTIYPHINSIDYHDPFDDAGICDVIKSLPIEYLVYEFIARSREELDEKIKIQDRALSEIFAR